MLLRASRYPLHSPASHDASPRRRQQAPSLNFDGIRQNHHGFQRDVVNAIFRLGDAWLSEMGPFCHLLLRQPGFAPSTAKINGEHSTEVAGGRRNVGSCCLGHCASKGQVVETWRGYGWICCAIKDFICYYLSYLICDRGSTPSLREFCDTPEYARTHMSDRASTEACILPFDTRRVQRRRLIMIDPSTVAV